MKSNIFFVMVDSLRLDRCINKSKTCKTPTIDNLIFKGTSFSQTISCSDSTISSLASLFTGAYPFQTGISGTTKSTINSKLQNFVQLLQNNGYHTYAIIPKLSSFFGIFSNFEEILIKYNYYDRLHSGLGNEILKTLNSLKNNEPWFYYLHLLDLHAPFELPKEFNDKKFGISEYDKMLSYVDTWLAKFLQNLNIENTLIIVTADHGEYVPYSSKLPNNQNFENTFLEKSIHRASDVVPKFLHPVRPKIASTIHDVRKKIRTAKLKNKEISSYEKRSILNSRTDKEAYLFDEILRIPLIFSGKDIPKNKLINQQVRNIDIFPTVLNLSDIQYDTSQSFGKSLLNLIHEKDFNEDPCYIESNASLIKNKTGSVIGLRTSKHKFFRSKDDKNHRIHLFDLESDPHEEKNISSQNPDLVKDMEKILTNLLDQKFDDISQDDISKEDYKMIENELRNLGYI